MKRGTRSLLYGAHAFWLHPWFVAWGWWKLYGFRRQPIGWATSHVITSWNCVISTDYEATTSILDPTLWLAFFLHDIGYWGSPNMDGVEGKAHPYRGARLMGKLFGPLWEKFTLHHSRSTAKWLKKAPSALCAADKLAFNLTPRWLYLWMTGSTGELREYMERAGYRVFDKHARRYWHATVADSFERDYPTSSYSNRSSNAKA